MPDSASPSSPNLQDPVTLLLINGTTVEQAESFCVTRGLNPTDAKAIVGEARKRITVAADYARDEQIGVAFMRLNDLYSKSVVAQDYRTALAAQKELSRTLSLYAIPGKAASGDQGGADAETIRNQLELIAGYLLPLNLIGSQYPIEEHARVAAETIRSNKLARV